MLIAAAVFFALRRDVPDVLPDLRLGLAARPVFSVSPQSRSVRTPMYTRFGAS
jgi:hypothetical protein